MWSMGQCASSQCNRMSTSGSNTPQFEVLPPILITTNQLPLAIIESTEFQTATKVDVNSTDSQVVTTSPPIKGIRKLKPRRRHFFNFHPKQHVTFVATPQPPFAAPRPTFIPDRRIRLQLTQTRTPPKCAIISPCHDKVESPDLLQECIMGNNVQKQSSRKSTNLKKSNANTPKLISKSSVPASQSTSAVSSRSNLEAGQRHIPTSFTSPALNSTSSLATAQDLEANRLEKRSLRASFFAEPPLPSKPVMSSNKFGFKSATYGTTDRAEETVPPKGTRTFQYQPPAPTRVTRTTITGGSADRISFPEGSSILSRLPSLQFVPGSKPTVTEIMIPPPRRHQFKSTELVLASNKSVVDTNRNEIRKTDTQSFGWRKVPQHNAPTESQSQVRKPPATKPFYLLGGTGSTTTDVETKTSFPQSICTGFVASRKSLYESKKVEPLPRQRRSATTTCQQSTTDVSIEKKTRGRSSFQPPPTNRVQGHDHERTSTSRKRNFESVVLPTTTMSNSQVGESSDDNKNSGRTSSQCWSRPQSGRSLSRERDVPISDSEYLIDDEISDQPELTFNFQDSSLLAISRSSSEDSFLLPFDTVHSSSPLTTSGTRIESPLHSETTTEVDTKSDSGFSSKSKPDEGKPSLKSQKTLRNTHSYKWQSVVKSQPQLQPSSSTVTRLPQRKPISNRRSMPGIETKLRNEGSATTPKSVPMSVSIPWKPPVTKSNVRVLKPIPIPTTWKTVGAKSLVAPRFNCKKVPASIQTQTQFEDGVRTDEEFGTVTFSRTEFAEILQNFTEMKTSLFELQDRLEQGEESERKKDELIVALSTQVNQYQVKGYRCRACGNKTSDLALTIDVEHGDSNEVKVNGEIQPK